MPLLIGVTPDFWQKENVRYLKPSCSPYTIWVPPVIKEQAPLKTYRWEYFRLTDYYNGHLWTMYCINEWDTPKSILKRTRQTKMQNNIPKHEILGVYLVFEYSNIGVCSYSDLLPGYFHFTTKSSVLLSIWAKGPKHLQLASFQITF